MSGRRTSLLFAMLALLVGCGKSDLIGTWNGVTTFEESKARYPVTQTERQRIAKLQSAKETLVLEKDGEFVWKTIGSPEGDIEITGTWAEKEKTVTLIYKQRNGKPVDNVLTDWRVYEIVPSRARLVYQDPERPELSHSFERAN